jgi:DNA gyrase subunit A
VAIKEVTDEDDLMIITTRGIAIRIHVSDLRVMGRNTQGVKLIKLSDKDGIASITRIIREDDEEEEGEATLPENVSGDAITPENTSDESSSTDENPAEDAPTEE